MYLMGLGQDRRQRMGGEPVLRWEERACELKFGNLWDNACHRRRKPPLRKFSLHISNKLFKFSVEIAKGVP